MSTSTSTAANAPDPSTLHHEKYHTWTRDGFLLSTDPSLISIPALTSAFAEKWMYWARPLPSDAMKAIVSNSLCFALYTPTPMPQPAASSAAAAAAPKGDIEKLRDAERRPPPASRTNSTGTSMIGFARAITDRVTFAYLTDVYVLPEWQGEGLGKWLVECVQEVFEGMPHLRRSMLVTVRDGPGVAFYEQKMHMERMDGNKMLSVMSWRGPGGQVL